MYDYYEEYTGKCPICYGDTVNGRCLWQDSSIEHKLLRQWEAEERIRRARGEKPRQAPSML